jgi:3-deoxy-7-phosphoheptulonate synthase
MKATDNLNILGLDPLPSPFEIKAELGLSDELANVIIDGREIVQRAISHRDSRFIVIVGPCSIHDCDAALEYAQRLARLQKEVGQSVFLVMRAYFEKPRTSIGWKGLLYDPNLDESDDILKGIQLSRKMLIEIGNLGLPAASEILDPIVPQYLCDLVSWAAIGARTAESQIHRQMASGLSMPIGFKNSTDGNLSVAIDSIRSASTPHAFLGITSEGRAAIATTRGNPYGHLVLRGGSNGPNYASEYVAFADICLHKAGVNNGILVDCSHANSLKSHKRQHLVFNDVVRQIEAGNTSIVGLMLESFLHEGNQPLPNPLVNLHYGVSITDECIGWEETADLIRHLSRIVQEFPRALRPS